MWGEGPSRPLCPPSTERRLRLRAWEIPASGHAARERLHSGCLQIVLGLGGCNDGWMWPCVSATHRRERCPGPGARAGTGSPHSLWSPNPAFPYLSGLFFLPPESLCHLQPLGQWSQSSKAGPVDPGPIMGTHQVWGTDPLWAGVLALSLGQCTAARDTYTLQMMTG